MSCTEVHRIVPLGDVSLTGSGITLQSRDPCLSESGCPCGLRLKPTDLGGPGAYFLKTPEWECGLFGSSAKATARVAIATQSVRIFKD